MTPKRISEIINMIPSECDPRLGGSCSLYFRGKVDSYNDIDIIVKKGTIDKVNLPFPKIELVHKVRLNRTIKYCIDSRKVDIIESMYNIDRVEKSTMGFYLEYEKDVIESKEAINAFLNNCHVKRTNG